MKTSLLQCFDVRNIYSPKVVLSVHTHVWVIYVINSEGLVSHFTQFLVLKIIIIDDGIEKKTLGII